jgi:hypothetical protein
MRLPPPPFWRTTHYEATRSRAGRAAIEYDDVAAVLAAPLRTERQPDGAAAGRARALLGLGAPTSPLVADRHPGGWQHSAQRFPGLEVQAITGEPVLYDPETDTLLVELRPWPAPSPAEVNEQVGGEDDEDRLVVHYGPDGLPHAFEIEHASERPELVARALPALRHAEGFAG